MDLLEFLEDFVSVEELRGVLYTLDKPRSGPKDLLISRVVEVAAASPVGVLVLLNNETLQNALRRSDLSPTGRKSDLVIRIIENGIVSIGQDDILSFLESSEKQDFDEYHELLLCIGTGTQVQRIVGLLSKASEGHLSVFAKAIRSSGDSAKAARALVSVLSRGSVDVPCFAAVVLEDMIEASGTIAPVASVVESASDEIMARQRRIQENFARHPHLARPAVDALLQKSWSGEFAQKSSLLKGVREEVRTEAERLESAVQSLRDPTQAEALHDVSRRAARIDSKTGDIQRGVQTLQDQLLAVQLAVQRHIEESPDQVAHALEKLSNAKEVKWGTRRKIRRDLQRFWVLTDRLEKIAFLGRAIVAYGPMVLSALRGLL